MEGVTCNWMHRQSHADPQPQNTTTRYIGSFERMPRAKSGVVTFTNGVYSIKRQTHIMIRSEPARYIYRWSIPRSSLINVVLGRECDILLSLIARSNVQTSNRPIAEMMILVERLRYVTYALMRGSLCDTS